MSRILLGSVLLTSLVHGVAWACSCISSGGAVPEDLSPYELVVYGEVRSVRQPLGCTGSSTADALAVDIEVIEAFVGAGEGEVVTVHTNQSDASCGIDFREGEQWLVFAESEDLWAALCGPSQLADPDSPQLQTLRDLER